MMKFATKMILLMAPVAIAFSPAARADESNQKTVFTFSAPVEIPGQILPGGTYVFKLADSSGNRHIVQVFNKEETHVFGTFLAIPDYRLRPSEKPIITFHERPAGSPEAIKGWFYPGRNYGHEFVYPKVRANILARLNHTPVPAMPVEVTPDTIKRDVTLSSPEVIAIVIAPIVAERPNGREVQLSDAFAIEEAQASEPDEDAPEELPSTGSLLPLVAIIGVLSVVTAVALRPSAKSK
jgi:hypothetical protein